MIVHTLHIDLQGSYGSHSTPPDFGYLQRKFILDFGDSIFEIALDPGEEILGPQRSGRGRIRMEARGEHHVSCAS